MQTALRPNSLQGLRFRSHTPQLVPYQPAAAAPPPSRWQQQCRHQQQQQRRVDAQAYQFRQGPDPADRVLAALPYLLPLLDALPYGRRVHQQCSSQCLRLTKHKLKTQAVACTALNHVHAVPCRPLHLLGLPLCCPGDGPPCTPCTPVQRHPIRTVSAQLLSANAEPKQSSSWARITLHPCTHPYY